MKNSEVRYPINGSSALRLDLRDTVSIREKIIVFPGVEPLDHEEGYFASHSAIRDMPKDQNPSVFHVGRLRDTEMVRSLRYGSARGVSFNRMARWQAAMAGVVFCAIAFVSLFFSV